MSARDFTRRMKVMVQNEVGVECSEIKIAKASAGQHAKFAKVKALIHNEQKKQDTSKAMIAIQEQSNLKLQKSLQESREQIRLLQIQIAQLKMKAEELTALQINERKCLTVEADKLHHIQKLTGILINERALPNAIKGVSLSEKPTTTQWQPFNLEPTTHRNEMQNVIWDTLTTDLRVYLDPRCA